MLKTLQHCQVSFCFFSSWSFQFTESTKPRQHHLGRAAVRRIHSPGASLCAGNRLQADSAFLRVRGTGLELLLRNGWVCHRRTPEWQLVLFSLCRDFLNSFFLFFSLKKKFFEGLAVWAILKDLEKSHKQELLNNCSVKLKITVCSTTVELLCGRRKLSF